MGKKETSKHLKTVKVRRYMQAGALTSMAYQRVSSLRTKDVIQSVLAENSEMRQVSPNSTLKQQVAQDQVRKMFQNSSTLKDKSVKVSVPQVPQKSSFLKAQVLQEQVQQVPMNSSTVVAVTEKRMQEVPRDSSTLEVPDGQDQMQQDALNSGENELSGEQGPLTKKKGRGITVMREVHARQERKLIVLNRYNQPVGPTNAIVTELSSFLGTLARNAILCPLNIHNWKNMDTKKDLWSYTKAEMEKVQSQQSKDDSQEVDAFTTVMGSEHPGCMRLYGRGVTKTALKRKGHYESYLSANDEKMQKQMEELEERMHQRMAEKLEQKATIHQEVTNDILGRLSCIYPGLQLSVETLAELGVQSPQEAVHPFNRPSSSNNIQGGENDLGDDESIEDLA